MVSTLKMFGSKKCFVLIFLVNVNFSTSLEDNSSATIENREIAFETEERSIEYIIALQRVAKDESGNFFKQIHMDDICTAYILEIGSTGQTVKVIKVSFSTKSTFQRGEFIRNVYSNVTSLYKYTWKDSMNASHSDYGYNLTFTTAMGMVTIFKVNQRGTETFVTFFPSQHWFTNLTNVWAKVTDEARLLISFSFLTLKEISEQYRSITRQCEQGNTSSIVPVANMEPSSEKKGFPNIQNNFPIAFCALIILPGFCFLIVYLKSEIMVKLKNRNAVVPFSY